MQSQIEGRPNEDHARLSISVLFYLFYYLIYVGTRPPSTCTRDFTKLYINKINTKK